MSKMDDDEIVAFVVVLAAIGYLFWRIQEIQKQVATQQQGVSLSANQVSGRVAQLESWRQNGY